MPSILLPALRSNTTSKIDWKFPRKRFNEFYCAFFCSIRTHIVHLSTAEALPTIRQLREQIGERLSVETCHHYLTLASEDVPNGRVDYKCCPPIRDRYNREQLWKAIKSHDINLVVSDHSPCTPEMKLLTDGPDRGNFLKSWGGISSVQFGMSFSRHWITQKELVFPFLFLFVVQDFHCFIQIAWNAVWASPKCIVLCANSRLGCADLTIAKDALPGDLMPISVFGIQNRTLWSHPNAFISATRPIRTWAKYWMESYTRLSFAVKSRTIENAKEINSVPSVDWSNENNKFNNLKKLNKDRCWTNE